MYQLYHEVFEQFQSAKTREEKIIILRNFAMSRGGSRLPEFLNAAFNPTVKFDISQIPKYKPSLMPAGMNDTYLHGELSRLYIFIDGHPRRISKLTEKKEQTILTQILSYLHPEEAKILCALLQKKVPECIHGLTASVAKEAFPTLPFDLKEATKVDTSVKETKKRGTTRQKV